LLVPYQIIKIISDYAKLIPNTTKTTIYVLKTTKMAVLTAAKPLWRASCQALALLIVGFVIAMITNSYYFTGNHFTA